MDAGIEALLRRSDELVRERSDALSRIKAIDADLSILKRAAEILAHAAQRSGDTSKKQVRNTTTGKRDGLTMAMLEVLREAPQPLTAAEVGAMAWERLGNAPGTIGRSSLTSRATTMLSRYSQKGTVRRLDVEDGSMRWCVAR